MLVTLYSYNHSDPMCFVLLLFLFLYSFLCLLPYRANDNTMNGSVNGNGSYKHEEPEEEIMSPRFSRPKVPEVTLVSITEEEL